MPGAVSLVQRIIANRKAGQTPKQAVVSAVKSFKSGGGGSSRSGNSGGGSGGSIQKPVMSTPLPGGIDPFSPLGQILMKKTRERKGTVDTSKQTGIQSSPNKVKIIKEQNKNLTKQQYFQEIATLKSDADTQASSYYTMVGTINPTGLYKYEGKTVSGAMVKLKLERDYKPKLEKYNEDINKAYFQAIDLPRDTEVTKTKEGYTFKFRDTSLDWSKGEFKKIDKAYKINPVLGAVSEFGFGAVSSFGALIKPALDYTVGNEKSRGSHFVSPIDVAFEPIGWSPKGSTELMKNRPIFTAGGIGAEVVQSYAMTQAMKPITTGVKVGTKGIIKRVPSIYGKFTKVFPEEKFISSGIKGSKNIISKGSSELPTNMYKWGAKGYKRGLELTSAGVKTSKTQAVKSGGILENVIQKTKYGRGGVKRIWLSPSEYTKVEKDIVAKLAMKKTISYSPQARIKSGVGTVSELFERTKYKLNWSGKRLVKQYSTKRQTWNVGKEVFPKAKTYNVGTKGGFTRLALEGANEPIESSGWYAIHKKMIAEGYGTPALKQIEQVHLESGGVLLGRMYDRPVKFYKGFGSAGVKPTAKKWISRYRTPFLQNVKGQASLSMQNFKTILSTKSSRFTGKHANVLKNLYTTTIPSSMYTSGYKLGYLGSYVTIKALSVRQTKNVIQKHKSILKPFTNEISIIKSINKIVPTNIQTPKIKQVQMINYAQITEQVPVVKFTQLSYGIKRTVPKLSQPVPYSSQPLIPIIPWIPRGLGGGGIGSWGEDMRHKKRYLFRQFKIPDIDKILKGGNIKL